MSHPVFDLSGRVAFITGGSRGLGKAIARGLAEAGADVVIAARGAGELVAGLDEIGAGLDVRGAWFATDMLNRADVARLAEASVTEMGRVDILVNNAGTNAPEAADEVPDANWDRMVELNLTSCMALTRALVPGMKERRWGRFIHRIVGAAAPPKPGRATRPTRHHRPTRFRARPHRPPTA